MSTPEKLKKAFIKDPWELLIDIRPVNRTKKPSNPDLIPITFYDNNLQYIGWQTLGALSSLFNCDFESNGSFWVPKQTKVILPPVEKPNYEREIIKRVVKNPQPKRDDNNAYSRLEKELIAWFHAIPAHEALFIQPKIPAYITIQLNKFLQEIGTDDRIVSVINLDYKHMGEYFLAFGLRSIYYHNDENSDQPGFHTMSYKELLKRTITAPWLFQISFEKNGWLNCAFSPMKRSEIVFALKGVSRIVKKFY